MGHLSINNVEKKSILNYRKEHRSSSHSDEQLCKHVVCGVRVAEVRGQRSDAAPGFSICEDEEGQRVRGELQMLGRRQAASVKVWERFIIHHLQHFAVQFH